MEHAGFFVAAPSVVEVGQEFDLGIKALTEPYVVGARCYFRRPAVLGPFNVSPRGIRYMDNVLPEFRGTVALDGGHGYGGPESFSFADVRGPYVDDTRPVTRIPGLRFRTPGLKFITVRDSVSGVQALSNPIEVQNSPPAERLFWGDLHSQTFFSDGLRCPEELYAFARHEAFLDVFALSDHSESLTDRQWDYFAGVTNDCNEDGRFVTLVGQEWTSRPFGHRNVYYPGDSGPILRCNDAVQGQLDHVYEVARRESALVIPHHSANTVMGVNWSLGHDAEVERLVEIHSIWGNSERPGASGNPLPILTTKGEKSGQHVVDALAAGYRFGFIGGGDIHDGRPGDELHHHQERPEHYPLLRRQGIMGVWATALTRSAIFDALWRRRVFATTNVRVLLRFEVNGHPMGSEIRAGGPRTIRVTAASEAPFSRVDLVRNGATLASVRPNAQTVNWQVEDAGQETVDWYYARLTRQDGQLAWSSPVWVEAR